MIVTIGDTVYHKLTGQALIVIENVDKYDLPDEETLECRYQDSQGIYQSTEFHGAELIEEKPKSKVYYMSSSYTNACPCLRGSCSCCFKGNGGGAPGYSCSCCDKSGGGGAIGVGGGGSGA